jgi:23S rRNA pseudouridine2605 synthase
MASERLQKLMAAAGLGSRRGCEQMIEEGRVLVNRKTATIGMSADPAVDRITVDGAVLPTPALLQTFALHKPRGVISSLAPQGNRATVRDLLPVKGRFFPVGRLDMDSEGLILLTNDGELAQRISHPRYQVEKVYRVLVARRPSEEQFEIWRRGVVLEDGVRTSPMEVVFESPEGRGAWLRVVMHEGRKHELREIGRRIGLPVVRIIRKKIGDLALEGLRPGQFRELTPAEIASLRGSDGKRPSRRPERKKRFIPDRNLGSRAPEENTAPRVSGAKPFPLRPANKNRFTPDRNAGRLASAEISLPRGSGRKPTSRSSSGKNRFTPNRNAQRRAPAESSSPRGSGSKPPSRGPAGKNRFTPDRNGGRLAPAEISLPRGSGRKPASRNSTGKDRFATDRNARRRAPAEGSSPRGSGSKPPSRGPAGKNRFPPNRKGGRRAPRG